ncbi:MAG: hypothetical protein EDM03_04040 [Porphyrobacter sp. IPPAS B-1204]|nr:MAG: hypothetical protein EDM03_04040 [Porphyrobacter sp. IPPAS B-1204]
MASGTFDTRFGKLHALHSDALTRYLVECRHACDGDLDLFLIMAIIGERTFSAPRAPDSMSHDEFVTGTVGKIAPQPINLQSIADFSGIPRETVRRKLEILIGRGWVQRGEHGYVTATDVANHDLADLTSSTVRYLAAIETMLESQTVRSEV